MEEPGNLACVLRDREWRGFLSKRSEAVLHCIDEAELQVVGRPPMNELPPREAFLKKLITTEIGRRGTVVILLGAVRQDK